MVTYQNPPPQTPSPELLIAGQHHGHFRRPALRQGNTLLTTSNAHMLPIPNVPRHMLSIPNVPTHTLPIPSAPTGMEITFFASCYTNPSLIHCHCDCTLPISAT